MSDSDKEVPLLERAELPAHDEIPVAARGPLAQLERDVINAQVQLMRQSIPIMRPLYARRNELITTKLADTDFWPRVFSSAPPEIDEYIRPSDAQIIGSCLKNLTIDRFEVNDKGDGEPRTMRFVFEFKTGEENKWFEDSKIVKEFYWRKKVINTAIGKRMWEGLVSEPVRIKWKKGIDPTQGLLDAACDLAEAERALLKKEGKDKLTVEERMTLPEFEKLVEKNEKLEEEFENAGDEGDDDGESSPAGVSFFAWFGYRGKDVTTADHELAIKEEPHILAKEAKVKEEEDDEDGDDDEDDDTDDDGLESAEVFPDGEGLALAFGDNLWPEALKYYVQSYEVDDFDLADFEDEDEEEDKEEEERPRKKVRT